MTIDEPSAVSFSTCLPLAWEVSPIKDEHLQARWRYSNLVLLRALASIEAVTPEGEHERDTPLAKTLERLESKIDIALNLLAGLTSQQTALPRQTAVTLSAQHIEWSEFTPPEINQDITLTVYLSPKLPEPLMLMAKVIGITPMDNAFQCVAEMTDNDEEFLEWMTRTVFRYHRRLLQSRHQH